jgi:hypothetical protein
MNDFIIFSNREKDAGELLVLSQNIKLLSEILRVEKGNLTNEEYLKAEKSIKDFIADSVSKFGAILKNIERIQK